MVGKMEIFVTFCDFLAQNGEDLQQFGVKRGWFLGKNFRGGEI